IGLDGGSLSTGEPSDTAGDGELSVINIAKQDNNVRYTGDRINNIEIKIGKTSTLTVAKNGKETIIDTGVFTVLKTLEDNLRNLNFTTVTGIHQATDTTETLDSENTGLPDEDDFSNGSFAITVTDHAFYPPKDFGMTISIDTSVDTLDGIATKLDGIPGMQSWWDSDGYLHLETIDQDRYSYTIANDTSNFLEVTGITLYEMQVQGFGNSLSDLDQLMDDLTSRISDFGALTNRTMIQRQIYDNLELSTAENLSEMQDTDLIEALMQLKNKETAYQAALAATARSLQISLVDFL
ncbi:MAG: flagellar hook-associated protein 3, partial [Desulfobulbaceae bacterium]|nr:flagellar hook-associated protein 3 [Desulfobulbaceae bacterium]